jgi:hypothetical protein
VFSKFRKVAARVVAVLTLAAGLVAVLVAGAADVATAAPPAGSTTNESSSGPSGLTIGAGFTVAGVMVIITGLALYWGKVKYGHMIWFTVMGLMLGATTMAGCVRGGVNHQVPKISHNVENGVNGATNGGSAGAGGR